MDQVAQIREKIDLVSFIAEYISIKKAGRNFQALCPFHSEKTPSFVVSPERQIWHCFGCGKGGDVYTFLMEHERMEFPEALRFLAKQTGIELSPISFTDSSLSAKKERLYKANHIAAEFYHYILTQHAAGKDALAYLKNRGVHEKLIGTFKLGFAPLSGKALVRYLLQKKQFQKEDLLDAGLVTEQYRGLVDFFRGRLIFPLIDHRDNTVGFSGRLLDEVSGLGGKYINTRDTIIYHKRSHFFGLNITKDAIKKEDKAILVEGEFDVLSCFQNGISNVIAVKGTAVTEEQASLLSRYTKNLAICFDADSAGQEAIKRSLPALSKKNIHASVITISTGKDPDEALSLNPGEFKRAVGRDINIYDYLFDQIMKKYSTATSEGKKQIADELLPIVNEIDNAIIKEHYLRKLSLSIQTTYESILAELEKKERKKTLEASVEFRISKRSRAEMLEEYLLALVFQSDKSRQAEKLAWDKLSGQMPIDRASQKILHYFHKFKGSTAKKETDEYVASLPPELIDTYNTALLFPLPKFTGDPQQLTEIEKTAEQLKEIYLKEKIKKLAELIKEKENITSGEKDSLNEEYVKLVEMLKR